MKRNLWIRYYQVLYDPSYSHSPCSALFSCKGKQHNQCSRVPNNWRARNSASRWIFLQYWHLLFGLFSDNDIVLKCRTVSRAPETCRDWWTRSWQQECDPRLGKDNRGWKGGRRSGVLPAKRWEIVTFGEWSDGNFFESDRMVIFLGVIGW